MCKFFLMLRTWTFCLRFKSRSTRTLWEKLDSTKPRLTVFVVSTELTNSRRSDSKIVFDHWADRYIFYDLYSRPKHESIHIWPDWFKKSRSDHNLDRLASPQNSELDRKKSIKWVDHLIMFGPQFRSVDVAQLCLHHVGLSRKNSAFWNDNYFSFRPLQLLKPGRLLRSMLTNVTST